MSIAVTATQKTLQSTAPATLPANTTLEPSVDGSGNIYFTTTWASALDGGGQPSQLEYVAPTSPLPIRSYDPASVTGTISTVDVGSSSVTNSLGQTVITGTFTANSYVEVTLTGQTCLTIQITGASTPNLTLQVLRSIDGGTTWTPVSVEQLGLNVLASSYTISDVNPIFLRGSAGGLTKYRIRCSARTAGTATVLFQPSYGAASVPVAQQGAPWSENITQLGGTNLPVPTGANTPTVPVSNRGSALYVTGSQAVNTGGTTTAVVMPVLTEAGNTVFDANAVLLSITNPSGSAQTITGGSLVFTDTVGGVTSTITYTFPATISIAAGSNSTLLIPLTKGSLKNCTVNVVFAANPTSGTVNVNAVVQGQQQGLPEVLTVTGTGINNNDTPIPATDVSNYRWVSVAITGSWSNNALANFQSSNDGLTWASVSLINPLANSLTTGSNTAGAGVNIYSGPLPGKYFRVIMGSTANGTVTATAFFSSQISTNLIIPTTITSGGSSINIATVNNGGDSIGPTGLATWAYTGGYNGNSWDRNRNNIDLSLLSSAARTATTASSDQTNYNGKGVRVVLNVTVASGTGGLQVEIQGKDSISSNYYQLNCDPPPITATGTYVYDLYPAPLDGYTRGLLQMTFKFQSAPTANTGFSIWFLKSQDGGTTFEDSSAPPCREPDQVISITPYGGSTDTNAHTVSKLIDNLPVGVFKVLIKNDGTGQTVTASNTDNVLTVTPVTKEGAIIGTQTTLVSGTTLNALANNASVVGSAVTWQQGQNGVTQRTQEFLPRTWRINVVHKDSSSYTYSASGVTLMS